MTNLSKILERRRTHSQFLESMAVPSVSSPLAGPLPFGFKWQRYDFLCIMCVLYSEGHDLTSKLSSCPALDLADAVDCASLSRMHRLQAHYSTAWDASGLLGGIWLCFAFCHAIALLRHSSVGYSKRVFHDCNQFDTDFRHLQLSRSNVWHITTHSREGYLDILYLLLFSYSLFN